MAKMTAKQQRFCDEYLIDLNATQAAIRAGYSKKTARIIATENLTKPVISEYISRRMKEKDSQLIASQDEVMRYLTAVMRGNEKAEQLVTNALGEYDILKFKVQSNQLRAAELLGKAHALFTEKVEQNVDMDINVKIDYGDD